MNALQEPSTEFCGQHLDSCFVWFPSEDAAAASDRCPVETGTGCARPVEASLRHPILARKRLPVVFDSDNLVGTETMRSSKVKQA